MKENITRKKHDAKKGMEDRGKSYQREAEPTPLWPGRLCQIEYFMTAMENY